MPEGKGVCVVNKSHVMVALANKRLKSTGCGCGVSSGALNVTTATCGSSRDFCRGARPCERPNGWCSQWQEGADAPVSGERWCCKCQVLGTRVWEWAAARVVAYAAPRVQCLSKLNWKLVQVGDGRTHCLKQPVCCAAELIQQSLLLQHVVTASQGGVE